MTINTISGHEKAQCIDKLQEYFEQELNTELGQFDAEFLFDFISKEFGSFYYNQGLKDAQAVLMQKLDDITEAIDEIELPSNILP